jgi:polyisoprenyl-teichoic acid--peptidoglycan teichoic acid transferase
LETIPRPSLWKRLLIGAGLVIFAAAGATAVAAFHEIDRIAGVFNVHKQLKLGADLAVTNPGSPQTLMLLGSDRRPKDSGDPAAGGARSDTIMLIRLNPQKNAITMMSLPRDLKVQIPGHGTDKINDAYALGGPRLTLKTVKLLTGLSVNHVINVDFRGFWAAVNAVGCVYADIDRRYFNNSAGYAYVNLQPGYQKMCGRQALQYVRFRHEDNDLVRSARQQDFLRQAKQQLGVSKLIGDREKLVKIFGRYTSSDIRGRSEVLRLLKLALFSVGQPVREVHFQGQITSGNAKTNTPSYVEASDSQIKKFARQFLGGGDSKGPRGKLKPKGKKHKGGGDLGLEKAPDAGKDQAVQAVKQGAGSSLPVYYPVVRTQQALYAGPPRVYKLRGTDGRRYGAYRMTIKRGLVGEYYGLQGTTWKDPPILANASEKRKIGRRTYELHYDGDRLRLVAWRTRKAVYWVSNTLLLTLNERQMLAIAKSARRL